MRSFFHIVLGVSLSLPGLGWADVTLPAIFSDHAVLQKANGVPVWGKADPGEKVTVALASATGEAVAGADGRWRVKLDLSQLDGDPHELIVAGKNTITVQDVLVGQVWLCSGQSNMEWTLAKSAGYSEEKDLPPNPQLRQFKVDRASMESPQDNCGGAWVISAPGVRGAFSGVGYYFQKKLQQELRQPVGVINSSYGGTPIEAWMSAESFESNPALKEGKTRILDYAANFAGLQQAFVSQLREWLARYQREDREPVDVSAFTGRIPDAEWKTVEMPNLFARVGLPDSGAIWVRRSVSVPAQAAGKDIDLRLGLIKGFDQVYWNGVEIGSTHTTESGAADERRYKVPGKLVQAGESVLALRIFSPQGGGGMHAGPSTIRGNDDMVLKGPWLAKVEYEFPALPPEAAQSFPRPPVKPSSAADLPTRLFNGMIAPLATYGLNGVLWYQGEDNLSRAYFYREELPLLVQSWRALWGQGDIPFYVCQLPNFMAKKPTMEDSTWPVLRESQTSVLALPNAGLVTLIDVGEAGTIHPLDKKTPGERLVALALAKAPISPVYKAMELEGDRIRISFDHAELGLVAAPLPDFYKPKSNESASLPLARNSPGSALQGFAICGPDKVWKWADAKIDGSSVVVSSSQVPNPVAVRYAWAANPTCNLYSTSGFPVAPFRTDTFEVATQQRKF